LAYFDSLVLREEVISSFNFLIYRTNDIYQRLFFSIIKTTFENTNERVVLTLLLKLNILSNMHKTWYEICQNNVFLKDNQIDSMLYHLKQLVILIEETMAVRIIEFN